MFLLTRCRISMSQGLGPKNTMKFRKSTVCAQQSSTMRGWVTMLGLAGLQCVHQCVHVGHEPWGDGCMRMLASAVLPSTSLRTQTLTRRAATIGDGVVFSCEPSVGAWVLACLSRLPASRPGLFAAAALSYRGVKRSISLSLSLSLSLFIHI